jgi:WhiB family transcriptional regulator, redox-sensing transcriptional regulator
VSTTTRTVLAWYPPVPGAYLDETDPDLGWQDRALCAQADPEAWFPDRGGSTREPKAVCRRCPVRAQCLDYALENGERYGVWGGLSEQQRRPLLAAREAKGLAA